jgi:hypothetical protein
MLAQAGSIKEAAIGTVVRYISSLYPRIRSGETSAAEPGAIAGAVRRMIAPIIIGMMNNCPSGSAPRIGLFSQYENQFLPDPTGSRLKNLPVLES